MSNHQWHEDQAFGERIQREHRERQSALPGEVERLRAELAEARRLAQPVDVGALMTERAEALARVLEADPHQFSARPCPTCRTASALLNRPFGCDARARRSGP